MSSNRVIRQMQGIVEKQRAEELRVMILDDYCRWLYWVPSHYNKIFRKLLLDPKTPPSVLKNRIGCL